MKTQLPNDPSAALREVARRLEKNPLSDLCLEMAGLVAECRRVAEEAEKKDALSAALQRVKNLEAFMRDVADVAQCMPDYFDSLPDKGNAHIMRKLRELKAKSESDAPKPEPPKCEECRTKYVVCDHPERRFTAVSTERSEYGRCGPEGRNFVRKEGE